MTTPSTSLERLSYALLGVSPLLSAEEIAHVTLQA
jgi:hypothetical protein